MRCPSWLLLVFAAVTLAACSTPRPAMSPPDEPRTADGLSLNVDGDAFERGATIPLVLRNDGPHTFEGGVVACATTERWSAAGWVATTDDQRACILMLAQIAPGAEASAGIALELPPGTYRFAHAMTRVGTEASVTVATRPFRLSERPVR